MIILALDPGTTQTGWVTWDGTEVMDAGVEPNDDMLKLVRRVSGKSPSSQLAIEMVASYGMAVGREVFETCVWVGRFQQAWHDPDNVLKVYRKDVKMLLCGQTKAKDANIRQALLDLFPRTGGGKVPQIGTKKQPGPLFGVSSHAWPALGVAMVAAERLKDEASRAPSKRPAPGRVRVSRVPVDVVPVARGAGQRERRKVIVRPR